jgi:hypothetical protein
MVEDGRNPMAVTRRAWAVAVACLPFAAALTGACETSGARTAGGLTPLAVAHDQLDANPGPAASVADADSASRSTTPSTDEPTLLLSDPAALAELESHGASFGEIAFGAKADSTRALARIGAYHALTARVAADLAADRASDPKSGVGMRYAHRLFDARWLESSDTRFELVAVVNRLDRRAFRPDRCGETRLVYRLAYRTVRGDHPMASRLPMTVNVVFWQTADADGTCSGAAARWRPGRSPAGEDGPLYPSRLGADHLKSVEINLQTVRWPSTVRPDMAGHAEYELRVFHLDPVTKRLVAAPLENTPDVDKLRANARQRGALLEWLRRPDTLRSFDAGTAVMPDEWAATRAVSVTPRGLGRRANRPFSRLFAPADFSGVELGSYRVIRSTTALLRRLDELSCGGCHQTRSLAGFHLLGEERDPDRRIDALLVGSSPHLEGDLERRRAYWRATVGGAPPDDARPLADHDPKVGGYGAHCGLGDPALAGFTCSEGLKCVDVGEGEMGACFAASPAGAGDPCEIGRTIADDDPRKDRVASAASVDCPRHGSCFSNYGGFPDGMCALACGAGDADTECGKIAILKDFNACLARGDPFDTCVRDNADPAAMRACDRSHACRDDYICARSSATRGVCIPPYFLFQLRVDGHLL